MISNKNSIIIRTWTLNDQLATFKVLKDAAFSLTWPGFMHLLEKRLFQAMTVVVSAVVYICTLSSWNLVVSLGFVILGAYMWQWVAALVYIYGPPLADMKDVHGNYLNDKDSHFWVAEVLTDGIHEPVIAGTIAVIKKINSDQSGKKVAMLRRMAVSSNFRRLGIAEKLVTQAINFCRDQDYDKISLITTQVHSSARQLYKKHGFKCISFKPYFYFRSIIKIWTFDFELDL